MMRKCDGCFACVYYYYRDYFLFCDTRNEYENGNESTILIEENEKEKL